ncbi:hypothetical protein G3480_23695 [Thiorhodococcus mannitoliphagus]|uniref:Porin n=1 Tax=Thiorhodococcus mannitoliphagus TaxID=329406 RepID=A0A6P1E5G6_9GAMM|nr:hypothetical protein [Thiorhodococcus mannitoliphagus]NEX23264.1 hypothetical protein [Thiorhodococcus mannitoliphagus]
MYKSAIRTLCLGLDILVGLLLTGLLLSSPTAAEDLISPLRLSGFGTLGATYSSEDDLHPLREWGQPDTFQGHWSWRLDSLLGVQANARISSQLDAAVQLVLKERAEQSLDESTEWAYLGWRPNSEATLRVGRLGLDFYLLSDYRNVGYAYLWERPPVEFYGPLLPLNFDGIDAAYRLSVAGGDLIAKVFLGQTTRTIQLQRSVGSDNVELSPLWGGRLSFERGAWRLSAGLAQVTFNGQVGSLTRSGLLPGLENPLVQAFWPQAGDYALDLRYDGKSATFYAIGAAFEDSDWQVSSEIGYLSSEWTPLSDILSAYLSVGRRFGRFTPYAVVSTVRPLEDIDPVVAPSAIGLALSSDLRTLYSATDGFYSALGMDQSTLSLGTRWDFHRNIALKLQWSHSRIRSGDLWATEHSFEAIKDRDVNFISVSLDWMF